MKTRRLILSLILGLAITTQTALASNNFGASNNTGNSVGLNIGSSGGFGFSSGTSSSGSSSSVGTNIGSGGSYGFSSGTSSSGSSNSVGLNIGSSGGFGFSSGTSSSGSSSSVIGVPSGGSSNSVGTNISGGSSYGFSSGVSSSGSLSSGSNSGPVIFNTFTAGEGNIFTDSKITSKESTQTIAAEGIASTSNISFVMQIQKKSNGLVNKQYKDANNNTYVIKYKGKKLDNEPSGLSINATKKTIILKWNRVKAGTEACNYQIQVARDSSFSNIIKRTTIRDASPFAINSKISKTFSGLQRNQTYHIRIRAYGNIDGGTRTSKWIKKSVRTK